MTTKSKGRYQSYNIFLRGSPPKNESFISGRVWDAESNGEGRGACDEPFWVY